MRLGLGIVLSIRQQHTEPPHSVGLLRANAERPGECDAKTRNEVPPPHGLPPQADNHNLLHRERTLLAKLSHMGHSRRKRRSFPQVPESGPRVPGGPPPISQPTKYEIGLNLRSAKELGIEIAPSLLVQANEVIEWGDRGEPKSDGARY